MSVFDLIEKTVLSQSVDTIIYNNLKHFYGYSDTEEIEY